MMIKNRYLTTLLAALLQILTISPSWADDDPLVVKGAWIAEAPPTSKVLVAYMEIHNPTDETVILSSVESGMFSSIELHETVHEDGLARMIRHRTMAVPARESIHLKRGGKHLMLFNPVKRLKAGEDVEMRLITQNNAEIKISVPVEKARY